MLNRIVFGAVGLMLMALPAAFAQDAAAGGAVDAALLAQGETLYEDNCSGCHQSGGGGIPPDFPALAGNDKLEDLGLIVTNVHRGAGAMPAFPELTADEIAALATYVRNSWGNDFGGTTGEEVTTLMGSLAAVGDQMSVWDGVYTEEQAARGMQVHSAVCAKCHGPRGNGAGEPDQPSSPAIARDIFIREWDGQTIATLFEYIKTTMPPDNPGSRSDQEYLDAVAQMLKLSNMPAGTTELEVGSEALSAIVIGPKP